MDKLKKEIHEIATKHSPEWVAIREHLHKNPELSFHEIETKKFISERLDELGVNYEMGEKLHYIVAFIGPKDAPIVALRADIDALPILEQNEHNFVSNNKGIMHACGHDVHTTCLIGAIRILKTLESELKVRVMCIFQPAEEKLPGGASLLIEKGLFEKHKVSYIIGQHVHPPLLSGELGFRGGPYMASADEIYITIKGKGGHAALPHQCVDPVYISSVLIQEAQSLISRRKNPTLPAVLSFGKIQSVGGATNVIPEEVKLEGTFRSMDNDFRTQCHKDLEQLCHGIGLAHDARIELNINKGYPVLINNMYLSDRVKGLGESFLGRENIHDLDIRLSAEDFAWYTQLIPGCFYRLGTGIKGKENYGVHHPKFDVDPDSIKTGAMFMAYVALMHNPDWIDKL